MKKELHITTLQIPLEWNTPEVNRKSVERYLSQISYTDIVVFPETFTTGFAVTSFDVETMQGATVQWMLQMAKKHGFAIVGSLFIEENTKVFNRMVFVAPDGQLQQYDKWHLFGMGDESKLLTKGNSLPVFEYMGWKIKPLICYDLRFPVTARNTCDYDIIICIANWPKARVEAWDALLKARAIENLCYVVGVNRVGNDANNLEYSGHSCVYNPLGIALMEVLEIEGIQTTTIQKQKLKTVRASFPFLKDRDLFTIL